MPTDEPLATEPSEQLIVAPLGTHEPVSGVADTEPADAGTVIVATTPVARAGPPFVTVIAAATGVSASPCAGSVRPTPMSDLPRTAVDADAPSFAAFRSIWSPVAFASTLAVPAAVGVKLTSTCADPPFASVPSE